MAAIKNMTAIRPLSLFRNSGYGLVGAAFPTMAMLAAYPILLRSLGEEAFGIYILATSVVALLAVLDLGFSSATTKFVAEDLASGDHENFTAVVLASGLFLGGLGILASLGVSAAASWLAIVFRVSADLREDAVAVFRVVAWQIPPFLLIMSSVAVFKGLARFKLSTLTLMLLNTLNLGSIAVGVNVFGMNLREAAALGVVIHYVVFGFSAWLVSATLRKMGVQLRWHLPRLHVYRRMLQFGSYMALVSLVGVIVQNAPKLLVGLLLGPSLAGLYALVYGVVAKVHSLVGGATEVIFPYAAGQTATGDTVGRLQRLCWIMQGWSVAGGALALLPLLLFPYQLLSLWLGADTATKAADLMRIFAVAGLFSVAVPAPFHFLNGLGMSRRNAAIAMVHLSTMLVAFLVLAWAGGLSLDVFAAAFLIANIIALASYIIVERRVYSYYQALA